MPLELNKVHNIDCLEGLGQVGVNTIDCVITDPPYGLEFMGKDWDKAVPSVEVWRECFRVLKRGAFAFVMCSPRQDVLSQMIVRLGQAGFDTGFTSIYWAYASGFPKSENISLAIDKRECLKRLSEKLGRKPTDKEFDEAWKNFREVIEQKKLNPRDKKPYTPNTYEGLGGSSTFEKNPRMNFITSPTVVDAKRLDGSFAGFQPKPAVEVIIVAMKPLSEKTFVDQALKNQKGITWLDECKIPYDVLPENMIRNNANTETVLEKGFEGMPKTIELDMRGRFPANLLVSDDILNDGKITKSKGHFNSKVDMEGHTLYEGGFKNFIQEDRTLNDAGSFSRYFDLDAWWIKKVEELPEEVKKVYPFLIVPKASRSEREKGLENLEAKPFGRSGGSQSALKKGETEYLQKHIGLNRIVKIKNIHPTVKALKLMSYLVTLGSREGDVVLDPFVGSGTTALACKILSRNFLCFEIDEEYCRIAEARLNAVF